MALRKRGVTFLNFFNLLQKEEGTHKKGGGVPQKRGGSNPGGNYVNVCNLYVVRMK